MKFQKKSIVSLLMLLVFSFNFALAETGPQLKGTQAVVYDYDTGEIVYTKDVETKAYPASMTKLMTAVLLAENFSKDQLLTYTDSAASQPAYSYGKNVEMVLVGDTMSAKDAMYALLLYSGNDIAYMIADNVSGSTDAFVAAMNKKAEEIGLKDTHYVTPNGLDSNTEEHLTTPYDMALLTKYAYSIDWIAKTMDTERVTVRTQNSIPREISNRNKNLHKNGCIGGKTGYTSKAGRCLSAVYKVDGRTLIGVVMNSEYNKEKDVAVFNDMDALMEYAYNKEKDTLNTRGDIMKTITVSYKAIPFIGPTRTMEVPLILGSDIQYYKTDLTPELEIKYDGFDIWKIDETTKLGTATIHIKDYSQSYDLYSNINTSVILKANFFIYMIAAVALILVIVLLVILFRKIFGRKRDTYRFK